MASSGTTAPTGSPLHLGHANHRANGVETWATKAEAMAALATLRAKGVNVARDVEAHSARTFLARFWVIGRPDHHEGVTYLMTEFGDWIAGRLTDSFDEATPWTPLGRPPVPATITHTYTYSAGSIGLSDGNGRVLMTGGGLGVRPVEVLSWTAFAWCVACSWSTHGDDEATVRGAARYHHAHPLANAA